MEVLGTLMIKMGIGRVIGEQRGMRRRVGLVGLVLLCRTGCWFLDCMTGTETVLLAKTLYLRLYRQI
jgi:hypothetical protein